MPYWCYLVEGTLHLQQAPAQELPISPLLQKFQGGSQASSVRRKQTAAGWIFKQLLSHIPLGLPRSRRRILSSRPGNQVDVQGVSPQDPRTFQTHLGSLDLSYIGNVKEQTFGSCFDISWECGSLPVARTSEAFATEKCSPNRPFPPVHDSVCCRLAKLSSLEEGKASTEIVFSCV